MATSDHTEWRALYRAAFDREADINEKLTKISDAEEAIANRMRELFRGTGPDIQPERESMDDAMYALRAWKTTPETITHAA